MQMTQKHPITPPPELLDQWLKIPEVVTPITKMAVVTVTTNRLQMLATEAARWGAEQQLDAALTWFRVNCYISLADDLLAAMRPKPPSLKEQALANLAAMERLWEASGNEPSDLVRRALEQLDG